MTRRQLALCALLTALPVFGSALIDPTRPAGQGSTATVRAHTAHSDWTLDSTLVAPDRRVAVINGKRVSEGETVDGARVIQIRKLEVLIQAAGKRKTLQLLPDIVKKQQ
jgi:MSHA biogenesis protein MshK